MEREQVDVEAPNEQSDLGAVEPEAPGRLTRVGIALAVGSFVGIAIAMVVAAATDNPVAAVIVIGAAVVTALGAVLTLE